MLGGAGNVARTLASLGARTTLVALIGEDETGREISERLTDWKIDASGVVVEPSRPTTVKTRVIARAQQMVRFDRECEEPIGPDLVGRVVERLRACVDGIDGAILQDYGKGLLERETLDPAMKLFGEREVPVFVDPKLTAWDCYRGAALIKPNLREARAVTGMRPSTSRLRRARSRRPPERETPRSRCSPWPGWPAPVGRKRRGWPTRRRASSWAWPGRPPSRRQSCARR
jgi:D-beta-D-heptose 7-phosphate kinase/D-beta-D-heptose 1-phosphate adenosyltransferase